MRRSLVGLAAVAMVALAVPATADPGPSLRPVRTAQLPAYGSDLVGHFDLSGDGHTAIWSGEYGTPTAGIFRDTGGAWHQVAALSVSTPFGPQGGDVVAISGDSLTVAVGGNTYVGIWHFDGLHWVVQASVQVPQPAEALHYGLVDVLSLSDDGSTLLMGGRIQNQNSESDDYRGGQVVLYHRSGSTWSQQVRVARGLPVGVDNDSFAERAALSGDGRSFVVTDQTNTFDANLVQVYRADDGWATPATLTAQGFPSPDTPASPLPSAGTAGSSQSAGSSLAVRRPGSTVAVLPEPGRAPALSRHRPIATSPSERGWTYRRAATRWWQATR